MTGIAVVGLGAIGTEVVRYALERNHDVRAVIDSDMKKVGKPMAHVARMSVNTKVVPRLEDANMKGVEVLVISTSSRFRDVASLVEDGIKRGLHVVTTCEELAFPNLSHDELAKKIDLLAKTKGVTVVGVGVNPGFVMDWVPSLVASASKNVRDIHVVRSIDVSRRRRQLQTKVGVGNTLEKFQHELKDGRAGHVGLSESVAIVAKSLGYTVERLETGISPVLGSEDRVLGTKQFATGVAASVTIRLELEMTITSADFDLIEVSGTPNIKLRFEGGVFGDSATVALVVNAIERIGLANPGLITVLELPLLRTPIRRK
jgi:4-hydroxy-tetrahydrodipicolinate reductase